MSDLTVTVDVADILALANRIPAVQPAVQQELTAAMHRIVLSGEAGAKRRVRKDTGHGRRSITSLVTVSGSTLTGHFGTNLGYLRVMEQGRQPGAKLPPRGSLVGWMRRHRMNPANEYVLRRAIARRGIEADHAFETTLKDLEPHIPREFARVRGRVLATLRGGR